MRVCFILVNYIVNHIGCEIYFFKRNFFLHFLFETIPMLLRFEIIFAAINI